MQLSDCPLFFDLPSMCSVIKVNSPPMLTVMSAIINGGYKVSQSHTSATAVKTNAPAEFVWDVMRAWERKHPVHDRHKQGDTVTARVLNKEIKHKVRVAEHCRMPHHVARRLTCCSGSLQIDFNSTPETRQLWASIQEHSRFLDNPETYWGPKVGVGVRSEQHAAVLMYRVCLPVVFAPVSCLWQAHKPICDRCRGWSGQGQARSQVGAVVQRGARRGGGMVVGEAVASRGINSRAHMHVCCSSTWHGEARTAPQTSRDPRALRQQTEHV